MSWRSQKEKTGSNEAPLGAPRRWGGGADDRNERGDRNGHNDRGSQDRSYHDRERRHDDRNDRHHDDRDRERDRDRDRDRGRRYDDRDRRHDDREYRERDREREQRERDREFAEKLKQEDAPVAAPPGERKRKSRWGDGKVDVDLPAAITGGVDGRDLESYAVQLRLDEIARALRTGQVVPPEGARSPSPPPTYDGYGRRTNTREVRYKKKLEDERIRLVEKQLKFDPNFKPPVEYLAAKRSGSGRPQEKVYIPAKEFPEINFFGLLVGPRGNSLKKMERESGAKISIRGKGSVKEGKGRGNGNDDESNEELHCLVMGDTEEKVQRCVKLINQVIETAASVPEGQNDHKRNQLRELAQLNGTLRDDENQTCQNCGAIGHRKYDCPEQKNFSANIICRVCGGAGHMARDCPQRKNYGMSQPGGPPPGMGMGVNLTMGPMGIEPARAQQFDSEYANLMAELGETSAVPNVAGGQYPNVQMFGETPIDDKGNKIPPWRIASNWSARPGQSLGQQNYQGPSAGYSSFPGAGAYAAAATGTATGGYGYQQPGYGY